MRSTLSREDLLAEFDWTRPRHKGRVTEAATILGTTAEALAKRLQRAAQAGHPVDWTDDRKGR